MVPETKGKTIDEITALFSTDSAVVDKQDIQSSPSANGYKPLKYEDDY